MKLYNYTYMTTMRIQKYSGSTKQCQLCFNETVAIQAKHSVELRKVNLIEVHKQYTNILQKHMKEQQITRGTME